MPRVFLLFTLLACMLSTSSCGLIKKVLSRKNTSETADSTKDVFIGVVESVNPEQKFVLVRTNIRLMISPGTRLESRSASGSKASLTVTPEHKLNFLSADIAEGLPAAGDIVILPAQSLAPAATPQLPQPQPELPSIPLHPPPSESPDSAPTAPAMRLPQS